jgi:hypothetical protein
MPSRPTSCPSTPRPAPRSGRSKRASMRRNSPMPTAPSACRWACSASKSSAVTTRFRACRPWPWMASTSHRAPSPAHEAALKVADQLIARAQYRTGS